MAKGQLDLSHLFQHQQLAKLATNQHFLETGFLGQSLISSSNLSAWSEMKQARLQTPVPNLKAPTHVCHFKVPILDQMQHSLYVN